MLNRKCEKYNEEKDEWFIYPFHQIKKGDRFRLFDETATGFDPVIGWDNGKEMYEFIALENSVPWKGDKSNYIANSMPVGPIKENN